jgi:hypothetical protein
MTDEIRAKIESLTRGFEPLNVADIQARLDQLKLMQESVSEEIDWIKGDPTVVTYVNLQKQWNYIDYAMSVLIDGLPR